VGALSVTVTVAAPDLELSAVEAARTVSVEPDLCAASTVSRPDALIFVLPVPPVTLHVTVRGGLFVPATAAVNCRVPPC
jgi:hypothetical protein